jgi:hypothetical protein
MENLISKCDAMEERPLGTPKTGQTRMNARHDLPPTLLPLCKIKICVGAVYVLQKGSEVMKEVEM